MEVYMNINGNDVEIVCTPAEFREILGELSPKKTAPPPPSRSFAKLYHQALDMSIMEYVAKDPDKPTEDFATDILDKCSKIPGEQPDRARIIATIEQAKINLSQTQG